MVEGRVAGVGFLELGVEFLELGVDRPVGGGVWVFWVWRVLG